MASVNRRPDLFRYTRWADEQVLDALEAAGAPERDELAAAMELISHSLRAQTMWLTRVTGTGDPPDLWTTDDLATCRQRSTECTEQWLGVLASTDDLSAPVTYRNTKGTSFSTPLHVIVDHVVNHATHHRAQIARCLRQAGESPPATDYISYARE